MDEVVPNTYKTTKKTYLGRPEGEGFLIIIFLFLRFFLEGEERPRRGRGGGRGGNFRRGGARGARGGRG